MHLRRAENSNLFPNLSNINFCPILTHLVIHFNHEQIVGGPQWVLLLCAPLLSTVCLSPTFQTRCPRCRRLVLHPTIPEVALRLPENLVRSSIGFVLAASDDLRIGSVSLRPSCTIFLLFGNNKRLTRS